MPITIRPTSLLLLVCATSGVACGNEHESPESEYEMTIEPPKPILDGYTADPHVVMYDGTYYVYPTSDKGQWQTTDFSVWSSTDLVQLEEGWNDPRCHASAEMGQHRSVGPGGDPQRRQVLSLLRRGAEDRGGRLRHSDRTLRRSAGQAARITGRPISGTGDRSVRLHRRRRASLSLLRPGQPVRVQAECGHDQPGGSARPDDAAALQ